MPTNRIDAAAGDEVAHEAVGAFDAGERLLEIDDVDAVALTEDEALHLRVPAPGLVPEVDAGLEHLTHGDDGHVRCSPLRLTRPPGSAPIGRDDRSGVGGR